MILLTSIILSVSSTFPMEPASSPSRTEITTISQNIPNQFEKLVEYREESTFVKNAEKIFHSFIDSTLYFGAGTILGSAAAVAMVGWAACQLSPWASTYGNECLLSSHIFTIGALHSFAQVVRESTFFFFLKKRPSSYEAWYRNQAMLSQIPTFSESDKELLHFLERRWLGKVTGSFLFLVDWMCPSFGISLQVHPETTNSYARDPHSNLSETYKNRVAAWKRFLPHPPSYPLLLTRPSNIREYLPFCFQISKDETIEQTALRVGRILEASHLPVAVDVTPILPQYVMSRKQWLSNWQDYELQFSACCRAKGLDLSRVLCIHTIAQKDIGGIRLLPFSFLSKEKIEEQHQFLLEWISKFGLAANRIELDRFTLPTKPPLIENSAIKIPFESKSKLKWLSTIEEIGNNWTRSHPQKTLMFKGIVSALQDLCQSISQEKWTKVMSSPTRSHAAHLTLTKIEQQLQGLTDEAENTTFYNTMSRIEQIHSDLSSLLEIFSPFTTEDFLALFRDHLTSIPKNLLPYAEYGLHAAGMTTLAGICKAVEKTVGRRPHIMYGENTYFECIHVVECISDASMIPEATEENWKEVDLIIAQFNPALRRIDFKVSEYHVEKITDVLHKALSQREGRPLTIAVDCTLDFSNSPRIGHLLHEFQREIERGDLNIICYRSPKFDLFGMESYCGAPFFMIHNHDAKWSCFDALLTDAALQTDILSLNWFCLAYKNTAPYLELYKKQIFDNTRAVLNRTPARMLNDESLPYRVIPMDPDIDPSFIDIKITGPFHEIRGGLLVGVMLTLKCMEAGHPLLYRRSLGFYHPNLAVLFASDVTTIRLTLGLDPSQIDIVAECMKRIDALNGKNNKAPLY